MKFLNEIDGAHQLKTDASNRLVTDTEKSNWNSKAEISDIPTYSEITEAEIDAGTSDTLRVVTGRRIKYILDKVTTMISALTKSDIGLSNVENKSSATIRSEITSSNVTTALGYTPANTTNEHTHSNKAAIDKFSESDGAPLYDGQPLGGGNTNIVTVKNTVTLASDSNTVSIGIAEFDSNRDTLLVYKNSVFADDYFVTGDGLSIQKNTGTWDSGTVFNFVAFQLAEVAEDTGLLQGVFTIKRQEFTATEGQTVFAISKGSYVPYANRLSVYIWGAKQYNNAFNETSATSFTMSAGLSAGDKVIAEWIEAVNISGLYEGHASTHLPGGGDEITAQMLGAEFSIISPAKPSNGATMWYEEVV